ncbi:MAG: DUF429 domain-containing protein [Pseudomonadota bacterium]
MKIYGIDFTSAPSPAKPLTCAVGELDGRRLTIENIELWKSFAGFESFLTQPGTWTAAVDFPIGQPRRLVKALDWPERWDEYVRLIGQMSTTEFVELIGKYRAKQPPGNKHHLRLTDKLAGSCSPMMLYGVPVGKMFFEGAPRLERAGVSVLPCRPNKSGRTVIEGYPALVVRQLVGKNSYKSEKGKPTAHQAVRRQIIEHFEAGALKNVYGISVQLGTELAEQIVDDCKGDALDAILCAVQAASFVFNGQIAPPIPPQADPLEGWIVDPSYAT